MKRPAPSWEAIYAAGRRKHHHRCRCCNRIIRTGESVVMARVRGKRTFAVHTECADKQHGSAAWTWRDALTYWGTEHLRECGWKVELPPAPRAAA